MPADLSTLLDTKHAIYASHEAAWKREEKRAAGGDAVLDELIQFAHEEADSYAARQKWARWLGFGKVHTTVLAGHLTSKAPDPNFGALGDVRELGETDGSPSLAELFYYNCDGVGNDGQQLPAFMDGVEQRALTTGFRWLLCEMPTRDTLKAIRVRGGRLGAEAQAPETRTATEEDVREGFRPYLVEYSPLSVTNWRIREGVLCWAVIRIPVDPVSDIGSEPQTGLGYYLLVRAGYAGLGDDYARGGWWKMDAQKRVTAQGDWSDTGGQIPLWLHIGEPGQGTYERPSIGQSSTMELGQISADLMNAQSEQRFNLRQAAKSVIFLLGSDPDSHARVVEQLDVGQIVVGVPMARNPDGTFQTPGVWSTAEAALSADAYAGPIEEAKAAAKEIMIRQIVAAPNASGARVEAEHESATSPMLARIAGTAEASWNTMLYFVARRFGLTHEAASAVSIALPREYKLRDVVADIDEMLDTLEKAGVESPTWRRVLAEKKGQSLDLIPEADREQIIRELEGGDAAALKLAKEQAAVYAAWIGVEGVSEEFAAKKAGLTVEEARSLAAMRSEIPQPGVVGDIRPGEAA
jgi:hypothetical protein